MSMYCTDEDFALWAFGDTWHEFMTMDKDVTDLMNVWNERHGELLKLEPEDSIYHSMQEMKELWKKNTQS